MTLAWNVGVILLLCGSAGVLSFNLRSGIAEDIDYNDNAMDAIEDLITEAPFDLLEYNISAVDVVRRTEPNSNNSRRGSSLFSGLYPRGEKPSQKCPNDMRFDRISNRCRYFRCGENAVRVGQKCVLKPKPSTEESSLSRLEQLFPKSRSIPN